MNHTLGNALVEVLMTASEFLMFFAKPLMAMSLFCLKLTNVVRARVTEEVV
jgi:hypothetical protein